MNSLKNTGFADRLSAAAEARKAQLERAARARTAAETPEAAERRAARQAIVAARPAPEGEREGAKTAEPARPAPARAPRPSTRGPPRAAQLEAAKTGSQA